MPRKSIFEYKCLACMQDTFARATHSARPSARATIGYLVYKCLARRLSARANMKVSSAYKQYCGIKRRTKCYMILAYCINLAFQDFEKWIAVGSF